MSYLLLVHLSLIRKTIKVVKELSTLWPCMACAVHMVDLTGKN